MAWEKLGRAFCPDGQSSWARHSFMTPVPVDRGDGVLRIYGGMRDDEGISRIGWIDVAAEDPLRVLAVSPDPVLDLGAPGMFDDNGVILGDVIRTGPTQLRMYYVGFQLVQKAKFLAYTGLAVSDDNGGSFTRLQQTPVLDRAPQALFINALHSIQKIDDGYRAWISCGQSWQQIGDRVFPQYNCWTLTSPDGIRFDMATATPTLDCEGDEYRIGRPRANQLPDGTYEMRVTSDTLSKRYACFRAVSKDGVLWDRTDDDELPRGEPGDWDGEMTCYPARIDLSDGSSLLFYNGNNMGETGVGVARLVRGDDR
ncbi:hypothetical protein [Phaeobacter sp.]|uniref:hypothetical protein n=1 Tax=Phaeobacter sp. TaxID=1902409 RepID=UPI0025F5C4B3|nr:hypothetical protein [Phaeobacter sp.]